MVVSRLVIVGGGGPGGRCARASTGVKARENSKCVCVCVCVCEREREREREREWGGWECTQENLGRKGGRVPGECKPWAMHIGDLRC